MPGRLTSGRPTHRNDLTLGNPLRRAIDDERPEVLSSRRAELDLHVRRSSGCTSCAHRRDAHRRIEELRFAKRRACAAESSIRRRIVAVRYGFQELANEGLRRR